MSITCFVELMACVALLNIPATQEQLKSCLQTSALAGELPADLTAGRNLQTEAEVEHVFQQSVKAGIYPEAASPGVQLATAIHDSEIDRLLQRLVCGEIEYNPHDANRCLLLQYSHLAIQQVQQIRHLHCIRQIWNLHLVIQLLLGGYRCSYHANMWQPIEFVVPEFDADMLLLIGIAGLRQK